MLYGNRPNQVNYTDWNTAKANCFEIWNTDENFNIGKYLLLRSLTETNPNKPKPMIVTAIAPNHDGLGYGNGHPFFSEFRILDC